MGAYRGGDADLDYVFLHLRRRNGEPQEGMALRIRVLPVRSGLQVGRGDFPFRTQGGFWRSRPSDDMGHPTIYGTMMDGPLHGREPHETPGHAEKRRKAIPFPGKSQGKLRPPLRGKSRPTLRREKELPRKKIT